MGGRGRSLLDPVRAAGEGVTGVGGISYRVIWGGFGALYVKGGLGVRISAIELFVSKCCGEHEYQRKAYKEKRNLVGSAVTAVAAIANSRAQCSIDLENILKE